MLDTDEQESEAGRLSSGLDKQAILAFAQHRSTLMGNSPDKLIHLTAVGSLAMSYANAYYTADSWTEARYRKTICQAAGFLHETMLQGCTFEDLLDVADEAVARVVAELTPDTRLARPKRLEMLDNRIGLAGVDAQLVKLADLRHACAEYFKLVALPGLAGERHRAAAVDWVGEASTIIGSLGKLLDTPLEPRIKRLRQEVRQLQKDLKHHKSKT